MTTSTQAGPPAGFRAFEDATGPFFSGMGPLFHKEVAPAQLALGLRVTEAHSNLTGIAHGGMLLSLVDTALGVNLRYARRDLANAVTVSLSSDFLAPVRMGDWLEARVTLRKLGRRLAFGDCLLVTNDSDVALRASAVFHAPLAAKA